MRAASWRVALRIARRDALRAKGRSLLVLTMIALPVLGVTGVDVVYRSTDLTTAQRLDRELGTAGVLLEMDVPGAKVTQAPFAADGRTVATPPSDGGGTAEQQRSRSIEPAVLAGQLLPAGSELVPVPDDRSMLASSKAGLLQSKVAGIDLADPVWRGRLDLVSGRAPAGDHELAATQAFLDRSGLKTGDTTTVRGLGDRPFTLTGVAEYPGDLKDVALIGSPQAIAAAMAAVPPAADGTDPVRPTAHSWLVKLPAGAAVDWTAVQELNKYGFTASSRSVVLNPPPRSQVPYYSQTVRYGSTGDYLDRSTQVVLATVVGMALLEIVLLAGPAFAVGARRSRRQLGLLAAAGGDRSQVRAVVLGGGVVLGLAGAVSGAVLAVLLVALGRDRLELMAGARFGSFALRPLDLLGVMAVGLGTGLLAAVVPAVQAARQDVVDSITGRGTVRPPSRLLLAAGLAMLAGGAALALLGAVRGGGSRSLPVLGGSVLAELGMVACVPTAVGLFGRLGRFLPLAPRLALRDTVRHRGRTAPAVAAVMAAVAGSVAVGIYTASSNAEMRQAYVPSAPDRAVTLTLLGGPRDPAGIAVQRTAVEQSIAALGPRADVRALRYATCGKQNDCGHVEALLPKDLRCPADDAIAEGRPATEVDQLFSDARCRSGSGAIGFRYGSAVSGDARLLQNFFGQDRASAEQAVATGKAVVFSSALLRDGKATVRITQPYGDQGHAPFQDVQVDAVLMPMAHPTAFMYLPPAQVTALGLDTADAGSVWLPAAAPGDVAVQRATAAVTQVAGSGWNLYVERGYRPHNDVLAIGLALFAGLVALGAAGIATGLAAADSQRDLATLAAVGATAGIRRRLSGFQCGVIAAMGTVLGMVCGAVPAVALRRMQGQLGGVLGPAHTVIEVPWAQLAVTLVALPLLATLFAALLTRSRITLVRRAG
ncbi:FtsX-like permease family protein [Kitasatospora sp. NPDC006697]|uniref:FtsX-like permease family protein n=1 Tax=Kitasatospora sp. NPDC006697 TaxID=3364020 RepID=UPI003694ACF0